MPNTVPIGTCGSCQVNPAGGGGPSECDSTSTDDDECPLTNSCPFTFVCCNTGECETDGGSGARGANC